MVVGLAAALLIAVIGISARELNLGTDIMTAQNPTVIKAGGRVVFTDRNGADRPIKLPPILDLSSDAPHLRRVIL